MAIPIGINALLAGGIIESERIECKESWSAATSLKTICAFANDIDNWGGGYIVIGIREDPDGSKRPVGVPAERVDSTLKDILNKCKLLRPQYMPICDVPVHDGKTFIVLWCPGGSVRPYSCPRSLSKASKERVYCIRKTSNTIEAGDADVRELYSLSNNVPFDDRPHHEASINDLDKQLIRSFLKRINSDLYHEMDSMPFEDLCRRMDIAVGPHEYVRPKNVGLMFFTPQPKAFFPCAQIDIVEFPEGLGGQRIIEHSFDGPLDHQLTQALQYLRGMVVQEMVIKRDGQAEADRFFNYPYGALEEALSNAVYHKGYDVREPIEVRVLPDRIEVLSYPGADRSISIEGLRTYRAISRRYRNRRVGDFLKELHLTEGRNTGMAKILRAMRQNGSPDPLFETDSDRLYFLTTLYAHPAFAPVDGGQPSPAPRGAERYQGQFYCTETSEHVLEGYAVKARTYEAGPSGDDVLALLLANPLMTVSEAARELGTSTATLNRRIAQLKKSGRLGREGSARSGRWISGGR